MSVGKASELNQTSIYEPSNDLPFDTFNAFELICRRTSHTSVFAFVLEKPNKIRSSFGFAKLPENIIIIIGHVFFLFECGTFQSSPINKTKKILESSASFAYSITFITPTHTLKLSRLVVISTSGERTFTARIHFAYIVICLILKHI